MAAIEFDNVSFSYGGKRALDEVSLTIDEGEYLCIVGGNGSGKSTLARHMNALLVPTSGQVNVFGMPTDATAGAIEVRKSVGMVFQNPDDQIVASIVEDEVAFGPENLGVTPTEIRARVTEALESVGLEGFERREVSTLSGGQKQRLAIAGALAMRPRVLVLDEASSMLDPRGRADLMRICHRLNEAGLTIVQITHFTDEVLQADRVIALEDGRIVANGNPRTLLSDERTAARLPIKPPFAARMDALLRERGLACEGHTDTNSLANDLRSSNPGVFPQELAAFGTPDGQRAADGAQSSGGKPAPIAFEGVSFDYASAKKTGAKALDQVSFSLNAGEILGIAGHTGSGKSTLVQLCNGLLAPSEGRVLAGGLDLSVKRNAAEARRQIGVVFQYPEHQLFAATVFEDVAFGPHNQGLSAQEVDERVCDALEAVHLDAQALRDRSPFALSGGQQRRVAFAGVLAMQPHTLVFDEPTAGLDYRGRAEFGSLLRELNGRGIDIIMVSHDMDGLAEICDRVLVLSEGHVHALGPSARVFADGKSLEEVGLAQPNALKLAGLLGIRDFDKVPTPAQLADEIAAAIRNRTNP